MKELTPREGFLPLNALPQRMVDFINEMSAVYQCHPDFIINAVLCAAATAVGNKVKVDNGKYLNSLHLWFINVAKSGENKTRPVRMIIDPLFQIQYENCERYSKELARYKSNPNNESTPAPVRRQLIVSDVTEEARMKILSENRNGLLCYYPEARGFFDDLIRYSGNDGSAKMMRIFDGDPIVVNRKAENEMLQIPDPFMCFIGDIQTNMLGRVFDNEVFCTNGFNQRFLFTHAASTEHPMYSDATVRPESLEMWRGIIRYLYDFPNPDGTHLTLTPGAQLYYEEFFNFQQMYKDETDSDYESSVYSKAQIQVLRIAGILHMLSRACHEVGEDHAMIIDSDIMIRATMLMDAYTRQHIELAKGFEHAGGDATNNLTIPQLIRALHRRCPITNQSEFARVTGISKATVSRAISK